MIQRTGIILCLESRGREVSLVAELYVSGRKSDKGRHSFHLPQINTLDLKLFMKIIKSLVSHLCHWFGSKDKSAIL